MGLLCGVTAVASLTQGENQAKPKPRVRARPLPQMLKEVVEENLAALNAEDLGGASATIHTKSPIYHGTKRAAKEVFRAYDLRAKLLSCKYVGTDGEYAVVRVRQETKKVRGPDFRNNEMDAMHVFRKEKGKWKFWAMAVLEVKYLDPPASAPAK